MKQEHSPAEFLHQEVYPVLDLTAVVQDLTPEDRGDYFLIDCPACGKREGYLYKNSRRMSCNRRNNCGYEPRDIIAYVSGIQNPRGSDFVNAVKKLARIAGVTFPEHEYTAEQVEQAEEQSRRDLLFNSFQDIVQSILRETPNIRAKNYLIDERGFSEPYWDTCEFGFYSSAEEIASKLEGLGFATSEIRAAGLAEKWFKDRITIPWRNRTGRIITYAARDITGKAEQKILYTKGSRPTPFGIDRVKGSKDLIVLVEGIFDALSIRTKVDFPVLALGQSSVSPEYISEFQRAGINRVVLNLDHDMAGRDGTSSSVDRLVKAGIQTYVIDPVQMADKGNVDVKVDPDLYLRENLVKDYWTLLEGKINAYRFKARYIVGRHRTSLEWTDQGLTDVLDEASRFDDSVEDPTHYTDLDHFFWPEIRNATGTTQEVIEARAQHQRNEKAKRKEQLQCELIIREQAKVLLEKGPQGLRSFLQELVERDRSKRRIQGADPILTVAEENNSLFEKLEKFRGQEFIGLPQRTLPAVDTATLGLHGLILLCAPPNVGKTTLALQFGLDVVKHNSNACFLFLSLEMPRDAMHTRIICRLAGMDYHKVRLSILNSYELEKLRKAQEEISRLGNRIQILDAKNFPSSSAENILTEIRKLKAKSGTSRAYVLVDYLQVWPIPDEVREISPRLNEDIWQIEQMKMIRDYCGMEDAIMVISEARKPKDGGKDVRWGTSMSDVMGSARLTYATDMLFIYQTLTTDELRKEFKYEDTAKDSDIEDNRKLFIEKGKDFGKLYLVKGRDGTTKGDVVLTHSFRQSSFIEGIHEKSQ